MYSKSFNYALLGVTLLVIILLTAVDFSGVAWAAPFRLLVVLLLLAGAAHLGLWLIEQPMDAEIDVHWPTEFEQW